VPTVVAISFVAEMFADVLHEGLGHAAVALLTGAKSSVLSTVAWSSEGDSRLVAAGERWLTWQRRRSFGLPCVK
jgi:hypothetical protein